MSVCVTLLYVGVQGLSVEIESDGHEEAKKHPIIIIKYRDDSNIYFRLSLPKVPVNSDNTNSINAMPINPAEIRITRNSMVSKATGSDWTNTNFA